MSLGTPTQRFLTPLLGSLLCLTMVQSASADMNIPGARARTGVSAFVARAAGSGAGTTGSVTGVTNVRTRLNFPAEYIINTDQYSDALISASPTITAGPNVNTASLTGMTYSPLYRYQLAQLVFPNGTPMTAMPAFLGAPVYQPTAVVTDIAGFSAFSAFPIYRPDYTGTGGSTANLDGFYTSPTARFGPVELTAPVAGTPTVGNGVTAGTHSYRVTFTTNGIEGPPSEKSNVITTTGTCAAGGSCVVPVTGIPIGPLNTSARTLYRTDAGDVAPWQKVTTLNDNTTTTYSDIISDTSTTVNAPVPSATISRMAGFRVSTASLALGGNITVSNWNGVRVDALNAPLGTVTLATGIDIGLANPTGNITAAASLRSTGTLVEMRHAGPAIFGATTAAHSNVSLDLVNGLAMRAGTDITLAAGNNNDVALGSKSFVRFTGSPASNGTITGLTGGVDGKVAILYNTTSVNLLIADESASSTAANRIKTLGAASFGTSGPGTIVLIYDATASRWIFSAMNA